jgi:Protein of unknown function (DUF2442).
MAPDVKAAIPLAPYVVRVVFADGAVRDADIEPLLGGEVFAPLRDRSEFERVMVDEELGTIAWPNGADLDPDVLYGLEQPASSPSVLITTPVGAAHSPSADLGG